MLKRIHIYTKSKKSVEKFLNRTSNGSKIFFTWIPVHIGINGNEAPDLLAKEAALYEISTAFKIHYTDFKKSARSNAMKNTREIVSNTGITKRVEFFKFYLNNKCKLRFCNITIPRSKCDRHNKQGKIKPLYSECYLVKSWYHQTS